MKITRHRCDACLCEMPVDAAHAVLMIPAVDERGVRQALGEQNPFGFFFLKPEQLNQIEPRKYDICLSCAEMLVRLGASFREWLRRQAQEQER